MQQVLRSVFSSLFRLLPLFTTAFPVLLNAQAPGLYINEVSQGPSGSKEYVELIVAGTPGCAGIPTLDLRGWYIDDNNGFHATGSGTGIAPGCIRFTQDALWSAVPVGTLIVIHNDADVNVAVPATDLSLGDGNCRLVIPVSNCTLLERHATLPSTASSAYPVSGFSACGLWSCTSMANGDDSYQTVDPAGNLFHSVSWGNNTLSTIIYFAGSSAGMVALMANTIDNNITTQANWTRVAVAGNESPGAANNAANQAWIDGMNNGCQPFVPLSASASATNTCACTGTATAVPSGGAGPYTYSWASSGGTGATETGLCPGTYTCTVTDATGCTQSPVVVVASAPSPTVTLQSSADVSCNGGSNGSATVNATGGSGTYTYSWAPSGGSNATASGLAAGSYTCTVTDGNGCQSAQQVSITEPSLLAATPAQANVTCNGGNDGTASVTAGGGTGPYTYAWSPSGGTGSTENNLAAGTYTCVITDDNGCTTSQAFTITQPAPLTASAGAGGNFCTGSPVPLNGTAGGPFTSVLWQGGTGTFAPQGNLSTTYTPGAGDSGSVMLVLIVSNACDTMSDTISILFTSSPTANITTNGPTALCAGDSVSLTASGGSSYLWNTGATSPSIPADTAGVYSVIVTGTCGSDTAFQSVTITQPPAATITASGPVAFCQGDSVLLTASGGGNYSWSTGDTTASILVNAAGTYSVSVSGACGADTAQQMIVVLQPPAAALTASGPLTFCTGGNVVLTASGGGNYSWSTGDTTASILVSATGTYSVLVTNACGSSTAQLQVNVLPLPVASIAASSPVTFCPGDSVTFSASGGTSYLWSTGSTLGSITATAAGNYFVIATNSCGSDTAYQQVTILPLPVAQVTGGGTLCPGDQAVLMASGGTSFMWSTGATTSSITVTTSGTYSVVVTNSCGNDTTQTSVQQSSVQAVFSASPVSGGVPLPVIFTDNSVNAFSWYWDFGDGNTSTGSNPSHTYQSGGIYTVTLVVTNADGCTDTFTVVVSVTDIPSVVSVPNVFTPNGDGTNDVFLVSTQGLSEFHMEIYDRWGALLHETDYAAAGWDGRSTSGNPAVNGTYYYIISASGYDGKTYNLTGYLMLIQ